MKEITRASVHSLSPVPENGNGKMKTKREYVRNGPVRSSPVQFAACCMDKTRELFLTPTICLGIDSTIIDNKYVYLLSMVLSMVLVSLGE